MSLQYHPDHQDDEQSQNILASINSNRNQIQSPTISPDSIKSNNQKEKSPMCLANELARFNEITHEYQLIEESGPAHQKTFTVVLKLGENEEYRASGKYRYSMSLLYRHCYLMKFTLKSIRSVNKEGPTCSSTYCSSRN